jgi:hypothetical protein
MRLAVVYPDLKWTAPVPMTRAASMILVYYDGPAHPWDAMRDFCHAVEGRNQDWLFLGPWAVEYQPDFDEEFADDWIKALF